MDNCKYTTETVTHIKWWCDNLFSFRTTRSDQFQFVAGQFARLGIYEKNDHAVGLAENKHINEEGIIWRPYSMVSSEYDEELEFYSIVVPDGEFTQRLKKIQLGSCIFIDKTNYGLMHLGRFTAGRHLWLLSTGTGIAPFISVLYDFNVWDNYEKILFVHCVRNQAEFAYEELIKQFHKQQGYEEYSEVIISKLKYIKAITRDNSAENADLHMRITDALLNGELERVAGCKIDPNDSRIMICGNPAMVQDTRKILLDFGLSLARKSTPGQIVTENLW